MAKKKKKSTKKKEAKMKIIHLSDLHIGYGDLADRFSCIINTMILQKQPAKQYVVVVTGDIVDNAFEKSHYDLAKMLFARLTDSGFTVLAVPGNHDYGSGNMGSEKNVEVFKKTFFGDPDVEYPKLDIFGNIAFIGLDSMAEELHWYDFLWANGEIGKKQLGRLAKILNKKNVRECAERVVYLHHHPFDPLPFHELKDSKALLRVLEENRPISALLYGHNHKGKIRNGVWGIGRCYDAGSATSKKGAPGFHRVIDFARKARHDYDANFDLA